RTSERILLGMVLTAARKIAIPTPNAIQTCDSSDPQNFIPKGPLILTELGSTISHNIFVSRPRVLMSNSNSPASENPTTVNGCHILENFGSRYLKNTNWPAANRNLLCESTG